MEQVRATSAYTPLTLQTECRTVVPMTTEIADHPPFVKTAPAESRTSPPEVTGLGRAFPSQRVAVTLVAFLAVAGLTLLRVHDAGSLSGALPQTPDLKYVFAGLLVGTLVGFTGMGGGSVMTPLLIFLGLPATKAIGTDLLYAAITKSLGSYQHARRKHVDWRIAGWLACGSVPAAFLGVFTVGALKDAMGADADKLLQKVLGGMLILVGISIIYRLVRRRHEASRTVDGAFEWTLRRKLFTIAVGVIGGFGVGLTSIGSGTLFAIVLMTSFPIVAQRVVGTDIFHATMLVGAAGAAHALAGNVDGAAVTWLLVGSLPGVWVGSQWTARLPEKPMRLALGAVLVLSGSLLF